jgi:S-adenosylmethionine synthetase
MIAGDLVLGTVAAIGYDSALYGFDSNTCAVISTINKQSGDIAMGVETGGAGDQGMMFGYATNEAAWTLDSVKIPSLEYNQDAIRLLDRERS